MRKTMSLFLVIAGLTAFHIPQPTSEYSVSVVSFIAEEPNMPIIPFPPPPPPRA